MERDERTSRMNIEKIIEKLNIKNGSYIAEVDAGSCLYATHCITLTTRSSMLKL